MVRIFNILLNYYIMMGVINGILYVAENVKEKRNESVHEAFFDGYSIGFIEIPNEFVIKPIKMMYNEIKK